MTDAYRPPQRTGRRHRREWPECPPVQPSGGAPHKNARRAPGPRPGSPSAPDCRGCRNPDADRQDWNRRSRTGERRPRRRPRRSASSAPCRSFPTPPRARWRPARFQDSADRSGPAPAPPDDCSTRSPVRNRPGSEPSRRRGTAGSAPHGRFA
uniref:Basic proline-rich protein n=1 Tax=Parastrongyloides trichosuri TaxID=131310 RepID=A0A0N4Z402_PARTI